MGFATPAQFVVREENAFKVRAPATMAGEDEMMVSCRAGSHTARSAIPSRGRPISPTATTGLRTAY